MYKFTTLYRLVDDLDVLETFFAVTHLPLVEQLPGLVKTEVSRVLGQPTGESRFHLGYELYFESRAAFENAMKSPPGLELMAHLTPWAEARLITWFYAEPFEEEAGLHYHHDEEE